MSDILRRYLQGQRWGVWAGLAVAIAAYLVYGEILPRAHSAYEMWAVWKGHQERLERGVGWQDELARVQAEQERLQARYATRLTPLASGRRTSTTFDILRRAAKENETVLQAVRPGALEEKNAHTEQDVTLHVSGLFPALIGFVHAVEEAPQLIKVRRLGISAPQPDGDTVEAEVEVRVFSADDPMREHPSKANSEDAS